MEQIPLDRISVDPSLNPRARIDEKLVDEYAETPGSEFPPVRLFELPDRRLVLSDGFHRLGAARVRGDMSIAAEIRSGTWEEAAEHAFTANVKHGKQLTRDEKTAAVLRFREMHPDWTHAQVGTALDLKADRVREIYQAQEVREETGVYALSQRRARAVANLPQLVAGDPEARRTFALTIERLGWSKDESEAALRTLKDPSVDDSYKRALLQGEQAPFALDERGAAILLPETVARQAREDERRDATGAVYELISASSALGLRLREAEFDQMSAEDVRRTLKRLDDVTAVVEQARAALSARLGIQRVT